MNRTRMRISIKQTEMLRSLESGQRMAAEMTHVDRPYRYGGSLTTVDDVTGQTKSIKRALDRLRLWGLVRLFKAPHRDRDTDFWQKAEDRMRHLGIRTNEDWKYIPGNTRLSDRDARAFCGYRSPVPRGNRQIDVVWAEITEAGREWLKAQAEP